MGLTKNHDARYLQSIPGDELSRYIDHCMTMAFAGARNTYREELQRGLDAQAENQRRVGIPLRVPLPVKAEFCIGEATRNAVAERMTWVEFTADQISAFSHYLLGVRP